MAGSKTPTQKAHGLVSYYESLYGDRYHRKPSLNRYRDKYGFLDLLEDVSEGRARELLDFYFKTTSSSDHSLRWFFNNYDTLLRSLEESEKDYVKRMALREDTRKRVEEFRARNGNQGRTTD